MKIIIELEVDGIVAALKAARSARGLSLSAAGIRAGMSGTTINKIENGDTKGVPLQTLIKVARAVNLDLSEYLGEWIHILSLVKK